MGAFNGDERAVPPEELDQLDRKLASWRQGDVILGREVPFIYLADLGQPLTQAALDQAGAEGQGLDVIDATVPGLVLVSQSCDVVRPSNDRPFVEFCPLVQVNAEVLDEVQRGRRPRFAALSGTAERSLVVDLDRSMTLEKAVLGPLTEAKVSGVRTVAEARNFAEALARKRNRAALPDDFVQFIRPLQQRVVQRHNRQSPEGEFLRAVREIRVAADPDWAAAELSISLLFVVDEMVDAPADADDQIDALVERLHKAGRFQELEGRLVGLDQLTAAAYLSTDRLDLDYLSGGMAGEGED